MPAITHVHNWTVVDYDDCDRGLVFVECACGAEDKMAETEEAAQYYGECYDRTIAVLPGATEQVDKLLAIDAAALGIKIDESK